MDNKLKYIFMNMPSHWNKNENSKLYAVTKAISDEFNVFNDQLNVIDMNIGIGTSSGTDIDKRWGALLNIPRYVGESDEHYRIRLEMSVIKLIGGTADAVKFAVCSVLSNGQYTNLQNNVDIVDAWLYVGTSTVDKSYGNAVCTITMDELVTSNSDTLTDDITRVVNSTKASGVKFYIIFRTSDDEQKIFDSNADDDIIRLSEIITPDDFGIYGSILNGDDILTDGTFHMDINAVDSDQLDVIIPNIDEEVYELPKVDQSDMDNGILNDTLYTSGFDDRDLSHISMYDEDDTPINAQESNDSGSMVINSDDDDVLMTNDGQTNLSVISDGTEFTIICTGESGTDRIIQVGQADIIINY